MKKETIIGIGVVAVAFLTVRYFLKRKEEKMSNAVGSASQGSCKHPNESVCQDFCEDNLGGNYNSSDRKCYKNGMVVTGGVFGGNRKLSASRNPSRNI